MLAAHAVEVQVLPTWRQLTPPMHAVLLADNMRETSVEMPALLTWHQLTPPMHAVLLAGNMRDIKSQRRPFEHAIAATSSLLMRTVETQPTNVHGEQHRPGSQLVGHAKCDPTCDMQR